MTSHDAIKQAYTFSHMVLQAYLGDLSDEELLQRPGEGCNHIAWQLGHLISSEGSLLEMVAQGKSITLPDGFADQHGKENISSDDASQFLSKDEYLSLFEKSQEATFAALDATSEDDLNQPGPEHFREMCPTVGALFMLIANPRDDACGAVGSHSSPTRKTDRDLIVWTVSIEFL